MSGKTIKETSLVSCHNCFSCSIPFVFLPIFVYVRAPFGRGSWQPARRADAAVHAIRMAYRPQLPPCFLLLPQNPRFLHAPTATFQWILISGCYLWMPSGGSPAAHVPRQGSRRARFHSDRRARYGHAKLRPFFGSDSFPPAAPSGRRGKLRLA